MLREWKDNPRHNGHAIDSIAKSIKRYGFGAPIIARQADGMIIAGHTRYKAAMRLGLTEVPVRYLDLDPTDAKLLALADNKLAEMSDWNEDKLLGVIKELKEHETDLLDMGMELDELFADVADEVLEEIVPQVKFSEYIDEANNYIVLLFNNEIDWLAAQTHFGIETKHARRQNGKEWSAGVGRVVNGAEYINKIHKSTFGEK